ncbi:uncharacterized protein LOC114970947 [Acropora millepora]|uniref:uncharacterized protein LOC114970947 n=1 Tax=Acropora millepora TaxID=45264 RepID=UPI001CF46FD9|nr:uncharacterized protein LOC114970947 [Acropora millepora]
MVMLRFFALLLLFLTLLAVVVFDIFCRSQTKFGLPSGNVIFTLSEEEGGLKRITVNTVTNRSNAARMPLLPNYISRFPNVCGADWQTKYQELHTSIIKGTRKPKFLVYSCPWTNKGCCGYGNRVYALVSLFYLAILTDRAFLIDWTAPKPLKHFLEPKSINWNYPVPNLDHRRHLWRTLKDDKEKVRDGWITKNTSAFVSWMRSENMMKYFDKPVEIATSILFFAENAMKKNIYLTKRARELTLRPLLVGTPRYSMIGCAFDFLFQPKTTLQDSLDNTRRALRKNGALFVGIHIRLGDQQFGRVDTPRVDNFKMFFACAKKVERQIFHLANDRVTGLRTRWFLATDSVFVKEYAMKYFPEKIITTESKPQHLDIYENNEEPSEEAILNVLHDHYILAESDFLVLSPSSFSKTAVGLGMRRPTDYTLGSKCHLTLKKA